MINRVSGVTHQKPASATVAASAHTAASSSVTPMPSWKAPASWMKCLL
jgi:hypothetical protein